LIDHVEHINGKLYYSVTPVQIEDLKPGAYKVKVKREGFYPWEEELMVRPNMVTKADGIVLFPIMQAMNKINNQAAYDFAVSDRGPIYYFTESGLYLVSRSFFSSAGRSTTEGFTL
jgi:hypothetical protein